jgi:hypothetical protein
MIPPGWTAIDEASLRPVSSFFMSFLFNKSYTRTVFFVQIKKMERDGWKVDLTASPRKLNGSFCESFLDNWCIRTDLDSRKEYVKEIMNQSQV